MAITTRQGLIDYCLRRLGQPVIEINIDEDQLSERVDDALEYFQEYHFDGVEKVFLKHTVTAADITNEYIPVAQLRLQDLDNLSGTTLIDWTMTQMNFSLVDQLFGIAPQVLFNRKQNKVYLETDWSKKFIVGDVIVVEAYRALDPSTYTEVYNDMFLKRYTTALIKRQWGENLKKFTGVVLPGGITLDGKTIYDEAVEEIVKIEEEMSLRYELPADGYMG